MCSKCLVRKKGKKRRGAGEGQGRCSCWYRPSYFSWDNLGDLQKLSDIVQRPFLIVSMKGEVLFNNRVSNFLSRTDDNQQACSVMVPGTDPDPISLNRLEGDLDRVSEALDDFAPRLAGGLDFFEIMETLALNSLVKCCLRAGKMALVTRKRGPWSKHALGWTVLGIYGERNRIWEAVRDQDGLVHVLTGCATMDWSTAGGVIAHQSREHQFLKIGGDD